MRLTAMDVFNFDSASADMRERAEIWSETLRVPAMSVGVYLLSADATDDQTPHDEDEIYYVVRGRAVLRIGSSSRAVVPGDCIFVAAGATHRFEDITDDLELLVVFAPAYTGD
ncbi:MAG TPA: cupin domain-containing protein [Solirubrobacteraceae bacterium]|nr:cupin domain-containing protein [Solirubrobacteraceae bacterium]